ncbi:hypothetical protein B0T22DRAFT_87597 [Podospora appendiculata]|uniref:Uncharacterized protein n=1 Tax=Podospora appendiculata TaxID=314037 RepID=A0AAE0XK31_9PEZI|nr:hypothetical protein B0T22DRAFT_87597 [Podospora appendiculata]
MAAFSEIRYSDTHSIGILEAPRHCGSHGGVRWVHFSVWGSTHSCQSHNYYLSELGTPRCDLYGSTVAYALAAIDNRRPDRVWFDLQCGSPTEPQWQHLQVPSLHAADNSTATQVDAGAGSAPADASDSSSSEATNVDLPSKSKRGGGKVRVDFYFCEALDVLNGRTRTEWSGCPVIRGWFVCVCTLSCRNRNQERWKYLIGLSIIHIRKVE